MQSLDVILLHSCIALEKFQSSEHIFKSQPKYSLKSQLPLQKFVTGGQALVALYNGKPSKLLDSSNYKLF